MLKIMVLTWCLLMAPIFAGEVFPPYDVNNNDLPGVGNFNTAWAGFPKNFEALQKKFVRLAETDRGAVFFLGDSITQSADLPKLFPAIKTANRGISGDTSRSMVYRLENNVLSLEPRGLVILCGTNDLFQPNGKPENTAANVGEIIKQARQKFPQLPIAVLKTLPNTKKIHQAEAVERIAIAKSFSDAIETAIKEIANVTLIDTFTPYLTEDHSLNHKLFTDGVHLNADGYEIYRKLLEPFMKQFITE